MRSTFCSGGNCVDVAIEAHRVELRDEADRRVVYSHDEWRDFVRGVKAGEFDIPEDTDSPAPSADGQQ
jgi:hypothetical protein